MHLPGGWAVSDEDDRMQRLIAGLRVGDGRVLQEFWDRYGPQLQRLAERNLAEAVRRRVAPEDVVQSVCRTFLRRARGGEYHIADSEELWGLLCAITLTKVRQQVRFHMRKKRGLDREARTQNDSSGSASMFHPADPGPTPAEAAEFADQLRLLLASFDEEERQIIELKLQDHSHEEVAQRLGSSERTVRRVLKRVRSRLERTFEGGE
jgi:RNA polymerase sigma-70 factor, ECF subfamily